MQVVKDANPFQVLKLKSFLQVIGEMSRVGRCVGVNVSAGGNAGLVQFELSFIMTKWLLTTSSFA